MDDAITMTEVEAATEDFLARHWSEHEIGEDAPAWDQRWEFDGPVPGRKRDGCYALLADGDVLYIGVGVSAAGAQWEGHGLGKRLSAYWKTSESGERDYEPLSKWAERGVDEICMIGFPKGTGYLAYGLEAYLLGTLRPPHNTKIPRMG